MHADAMPNCTRGFLAEHAAMEGVTASLLYDLPILLREPRPLTTHQFYPDAHSGGRGSPKVSSLTMRRRPLVNHDSRLRLMFLG